MHRLLRKYLALIITIFLCALMYHAITVFANLLLIEDSGYHTPSVTSSKEFRSKSELKPRDLKELTNAVVLNTAFYMWCGNETFTYKHYLSVQSVWRHMEPESITIFYKSLPRQDDYNDWLDRLMRSIPNLRMTELQTWYTCDKNKEILVDFLNDQGGLYVSFDTVILKQISHLRNKNITAFVDSEGDLKLLFTLRKSPLIRTLPYFRNTGLYMKPQNGKKVDTRFCQKISNEFNDPTRTVGACGHVVGTIYPRDIITADDPLASCLRYVSYGTAEPILPITDQNTLIPKVVHYVWYNEKTMTFMMYLSVLSSLFVINADAVYIHGGTSLKGDYIEKVKAISRVKIIHREASQHIFGNLVFFSHHKSDVIRGDILQKYGGIYMDWDVLWVNPIDDLIETGYDVILSLDHAAQNPFPSSINMGVVLSKPRSKFIEIWRKTYRQYKNDKFLYNPVQMPYKVYELHPNLVRIEPRLQVMCFRLMCHPTFHPDFRDIYHAQPFDWKADVRAIHFTYPDPNEFQSEEALAQGSGMFADIGKYILKMSIPHLSPVQQS